MRRVILALLTVTLAGCAASGSPAPTSSATGASTPSPAPSATAPPSDRPTVVAPTPRPTLTADATLFTAAPVVAIADASTDFDDPAELDRWRVSQGEAMDGGTTTFDVADGVLRIVAAQSKWIRRDHGASAGRTMDGDFVATVRVRATGAAGGLPAVPWSLAGLMLRAPTTDPAVENWVHWSAGALGDWTLERKETRNGGSELALVRVPAGWVELRVVRQGAGIALLHRSEGGAWTFDHAYYRPDLPAALELLLTAQTGGESDRGDLVATFDWLHVEAARLSSEMAADLEGGRGVDGAALVAELGD